MSNPRVRVFIGSSVEGRRVAEALQANLDVGNEVVIWSQGVFEPGAVTLRTLVADLGGYDFAVLIFTADDTISIRGSEAKAPRDNVVFELGLFMGSLGSERTFVVTNRDAKVRMPTDLAGVTVATFVPHSDGNLQAALGSASTSIRTAMGRLGPRQRLTGGVDQATHFRAIAGLLEEMQLQCLILMHEQRVSLSARSPVFIEGPAYEYDKCGRSAGWGGLSVGDMCEKLADAGLLQIDLRFNVTLTDRGHELVRWLVDNGRKASYFRCPYGGWGDRPKDWAEHPMPGVPKARFGPQSTAPPSAKAGGPDSPKAAADVESQPAS